MDNLATMLAHRLLGINAIKLSPSKPFVWASGWKSPIYTDNRLTLSHPSLRSFIKVELSRLVLENFGDAQVVAGVATGAIAQGALVSDALCLPMVYVRSAPKNHGMENLIEGSLQPGQKVVIVEDLVSTGMSSLKAVEAVRKAGAQVVGMVAIFTYEFPQAAQAFEQAGVKLVTISNYSALVKAAIAAGVISASEEETLHQWRNDPAHWKQ